MPTQETVSKSEQNKDENLSKDSLKKNISKTNHKSEEKGKAF